MNGDFWELLIQYKHTSLHLYGTVVYNMNHQAFPGAVVTLGFNS